ncbi:amino-acid N-acetyltransferase, partial [Acinetobacter sp. ULE_I010]
PYINAHRDKTFVLMVGGEAVQDQNFQHIIHDIALLHSLGLRLILVHGARPQINDNLKEKNIQSPIHINRRVTTRESLPCVMNAVGSSRLQIEALLSMGLANSPMFG